MIKLILPSLSFALISLSTSAQDTPILAPPLQVSEKPLVSVQQTGQDDSVSTALQSLPGVVILPQGVPVGQSDLSIRGSSFSGAGLSMFGLSLGNAQTEHFNADLPFPAWWFSGPEVLTGVEQALRSEGHLTGTVLLSPLPIQNQKTVTLGVDNKDGYWGNTGAQQVFEKADGSQIGVGVYAGYSEIPGVDFPDNDVQVARAGASIQKITDGGQGDLMIGHQDKTFGARGYYGVSDALKAEENTQDTLLIGNWQSADPASKWDASFMLRQFEDDYKLWLPTALFQNTHKTRSAATQAGRQFLLSDAWTLKTRLAADVEEIESNSLGDFSRYQLSATMVPEWQATTQLKLSAGLRGEILEDDKNQLLPLARIDFDWMENLALHAEFSQTVRRPSYTELNYESPGSLGNAGLDLQEQTAIEAGIHWQANEKLNLQALVFQYQTSDTVDWIRPDAEATRWQAENIGDVDTLGSEFILGYQLQEQLHFTTSYMWMDKDPDDAPYASRYSLDYARNFVRVQLDWSPLNWMRIELSQWYRDQVENALRTEGGNEQWLTNVAVHFRICENTQLSLMANNATDDDYRVYPGQNTVTQRRVSAGLTMDW
ncbi:TonB-dependent receptor [Kiritimatiellaeota bacterium B1221]|nr:TonB-dependent receptor [Kiritimatiellaeota bacterium B1221]